MQRYQEALAEMSVEVYALCLGRARCFECEVFPDVFSGASARSGSDLVLPKGEELTYALNAYVIRSGSRCLLVDTGFNEPSLATMNGVEGYRQVAQVLPELNLAPADITDVVITHGHWANIGGLADYIHARIWIASDEVQAMRNAVSESNFTDGAYRWQDLQILESAKRLHLINRCRAVTESVRVDKIAGHTPGCFAVVVLREGLRSLVLAGDNAWFYQNLQGRKLSPGLRFGGNDSLPRLKSRCREAVFVPGRDLDVYKRYPSVGEWVSCLYSSSATPQY